MNTSTAWRVGAAELDITPKKSAFLFGYPHVERYSTGVHDPLLASAVYVSDEQSAAIFVGCDVIFVSRAMTHRARQRIADAVGLPAEHIMITASHTHSGPITMSMLSNEGDATVPAPDADYLQQLEDGIVRAAVHAHATAAPATLDHAVADGRGLGTNRRAPDGPTIPAVPVLLARRSVDREPIAVMAVVSMHPTVLHEDWTLVSGDFPGLARVHLQKQFANCPFIYHMGASGNQSPRHVTKANTIEEANRLGRMLSDAIQYALQNATPLTPTRIDCTQNTVELPLRSFPTVDEAQARLKASVDRLAELRDANAPRTQVRTAECDWFGAEETLALAQANVEQRLAAAARQCMPAEVQVIRIGSVTFVGWPGEVFVEFAMQVTAEHPDAHIITLANGDLQGYLVTQQAIDENAYEAGNAIFASPDSGDRLVAATRELLDRLA
ncbi:neutral/alkaline non-lysosomal ceramidase N-terminal domain-containing protein [Phycisphaerales bacterium AB-hyl4]|uniref:Neutral ceramidase n=1 Tax=Natronomicrosphaera hydrolytica TaxID=3242702 RepID=A0ABV4UBS3_9BACT